MEALVAVGLAGNVVQFAQFAGNLVSEMKCIRETGSPSSLPALRSLVESLLKQAEVIHRCLSTRDSVTQLSDEDQYLINTAEECQKTGSSFLQYLDTLIRQSTSSNRMIRAGRAFKFQFQQHKVNEFSSKIDRLQSALMLATMLAFRTRAKADHEEILLHLQELQNETTNSDHSLHNTIRLLDGIVGSRTDQKLVALESLVQKCLLSIEKCRENSPQTRETKILTWLSFRQIAWRYAEISSTYKQTYDWIFEVPSVNSTWDNFEEHLTQNVTKPYFINGKAGSGKSTLMKYVLDHPKLGLYLWKWASAAKMELLIAQFFFWNLGTPLQKTTTGLLRSLLWTILSQRPELIPIVFPDRYRDLDFENGDPIYIEIKQAWNTLVQKSRDFLKIAIFIDGIDEFDGNPSDLLDFIMNLCSFGIKLVVSSRPINSSLHAFNSCPSLKLQDLTKSDMALYIHGKLQQHPLMEPLAKHCPEVSKAILSEMEERAQGVFLWVKLVVKLLVDGLLDGDRPEDLLVKLRSLPSDLKALYRRMISQIPPEYQRQAAEIFQLLRTWQTSQELPLVTALLYFALLPPQESVTGKPRQLKLQTYEYNCEQLLARVRARSCGLLEVTVDPVNCAQDKSRIGYLHRTVGEFLETEDVKKEMDGFPQISFDPCERLVAACLSLIQVTGPSQLKSWFNPSHYGQAILTFYRDSSHELRRRLEIYLTALDDVMTDYYSLETQERRNQRPPQESESLHHWSRFTYMTSLFLRKNDRRWNESSRYDEARFFVNNKIVDRETTMLGVVAFLGFAQYLEVKCTETVFNPFSLLQNAFDSWSSLWYNQIPLGDRRDTLMFLLKKATEMSDKNLRKNLLGYCELSLPKEDQEKGILGEKERRVFISCIIVTTKFSPESWVNKYTTAELRDISKQLQQDEDPENRRLGVRLSEAIDERLSGDQICGKCRIPGHASKTCQKSGRGRKKKKKKGVKTGRIQKRENRKSS